MEYETKSGRAGPGNPTSPRHSVRKNLDFEPLSTTALILEDRPANLPAKPAEEAQKHRQQYEEMVAQAKKRGEESRFRAGVSSTRKTSPPEGPIRPVG
ncbi:TBC1 domain family member 14-like [Notothenia coriiceps]|uniref:TBC1 domain family member 14-like n=1 Tax=Notothenia coriiceps TaxID=8208 RepID=A0A6I9MYI7_9TELE|nr:PREDICTED: TBC1 domain family member 14-like [Notothenia coriiceps]